MDGRPGHSGSPLLAIVLISVLQFAIEASGLAQRERLFRPPGYLDVKQPALRLAARTLGAYSALRLAATGAARSSGRSAMLAA